MRTIVMTSLTALALVAAAPATAPAEEGHRELGAHEHGHGTLSIAVENTSVAMELEVPGMDIVGFEHEAESADQKAAVAKAKDELANPLALFKFPESAGCSVKEAKVEIETEGEHGHEAGEGHDGHSKADGHDGAEHAGADHDGEGHEGHNAFHVTYAIDCSKPTNLTSIAFDYFKAFAGAQELTVNVVTAKAQNSYEVSRDKPTLDLGGMM